MEPYRIDPIIKAVLKRAAFAFLVVVFMGVCAVQYYLDHRRSEPLNPVARWDEETGRWECPQGYEPVASEQEARQPEYFRAHCAR